ncbi:MAG: SdpI family protein [Methanomicrobiales archaeon]|nr:SdpI family protein [Methanomicrobiales archaeon]
MHLTKPVTVACGLLVLIFAVSIILFPSLPKVMAIHWDMYGVANGYWPKPWALFFTPFLALGLTLFLLWIPRLDPLRENIETFRPAYEWFVAGFVAFFLYLHLLTLAWNLGFRFSLVQALCPAFAALYFGIGILIGRAKRNWFIGIRTPWTLSSDRVWERTHRRGALLFKLSGILALAGTFAGELAFFLILVPVLFSAIYTVAYSYREYQREIQGPGPSSGQA